MGDAKLRAQLAVRPNAVRFSEVRRLLESYDWVLDRIHGSHHTFVRGGETFVVPLRRPHVLPVYVREALKRCS